MQRLDSLHGSDGRAHMRSEVGNCALLVGAGEDVVVTGGGDVEIAAFRVLGNDETQSQPLCKDYIKSE